MLLSNGSIDAGQRIPNLAAATPSEAAFLATSSVDDFISCVSNETVV